METVGHVVFSLPLLVGDHVPGALAPCQAVRSNAGGHEVSLVRTGNMSLAVLEVVPLGESH